MATKIYVRFDIISEPLNENNMVKILKASNVLYDEVYLVVDQITMFIPQPRRITKIICRGEEFKVEMDAVDLIKRVYGEADIIVPGIPQTIS